MNTFLNLHDLSPVHIWQLTQINRFNKDISKKRANYLARYHKEVHKNDSDTVTKNDTFDHIKYTIRAFLPIHPLIIVSLDSQSVDMLL